MPNMNVLELTIFIRRINKSIPIVLISEYTDRDVLINFISFILVEYLIKVIDF